ncbi:MAG: LysM domain-containing protein [Chloroflexota bacterium]|nr:LysM domain-containing protein [Chloroflexota bacterium]MDE2840604.1 LysM domain-containing protein [Chloroflexota bacterium]MDE2931457.1 LysM domain-containing protein [Chloroflexota bacterium]
MKQARSSITQLVVLGVALAVLTVGCIPFMGDENSEEVPPTPTPTITIIRPSPTPVPGATVQPAEETIYTVVSGDTLSSIADKFPGVTWQEIAAANDLKDPYPLSIGQKLIIPPPPGQEPAPTPAGPSVVKTPEPKN